MATLTAIGQQANLLLASCVLDGLPDDNLGLATHFREHLGRLMEVMISKRSEGHHLAVNLHLRVTAQCQLSNNRMLPATSQPEQHTAGSPGSDGVSRRGEGPNG